MLMGRGERMDDHKPAGNIPPTSPASEINLKAAETGLEPERNLESAQFRASQAQLQTERETKPRRTRPVFVVGCPRSGTTLLYHMILSSGDFAVFPLETFTFSVLGRKFRNLNSMRKRQNLMKFWLSEHILAQSGLDRKEIEPRLLRNCRHIGDFLRIVMEAICRQQGVRRWAEKTPDHGLYIRQIKRVIPDALVVHIIRDGRDAALSLANFGRIRPFFWPGCSKLLSFGVYWKWMLRKARANGKRISPDYYELRYEDLVEKPRETLAKLGDFIDHDLNYDRIRQAAIGSVSRPETSFQSESSPERFNPVGRWRTRFSPEELAGFEALVGDCLKETGYSLATQQKRRSTFSSRVTSGFCLAQLEVRHWLKNHTTLHRLAGRTRQP
jgi:hypothetical protein